jgi:hypothetical protein
MEAHEGSRHNPQSIGSQGIYGSSIVNHGNIIYSCVYMEKMRHVEAIPRMRAIRTILKGVNSSTRTFGNIALYPSITPYDD